jgi:hypothetical protein
MTPKMKLVVVGVVVVLVGAVVGVRTYQQSLIKPAKLTALSIVHCAVRQDVLKLEVQTVPPGFAGTGTLKIMHNGDYVHTDESLEFRGGFAAKDVQYEDFLIANGEYVVEVYLFDEKATQTIQIFGIVERLSRVEVAPVQGSSPPRVNIAVWHEGGVLPDIKEPFVTEASVRLTNVEGDYTIETTLRFTGTVYENVTRYSESGFYRVEVELKNRVKPDSPYASVVCSWEGLVNQKPVFEALPPAKKTIRAEWNPETGEWEARVHFVSKDRPHEEENSVTYLVADYDDEIALVAWEMGYNQTLGKKAMAAENETNDTREGYDFWYTYPAERERETYIAKMQVKDTHGYIEVANCEIEVQRLV